MVSLGEVKGREHLGTCHRLELLLNVVHRVCVFLDVLVNHAEVDAYLEGPFGFWYAYHRQQVWVSISLIGSTCFILANSLQLAATVAGDYLGT